MIVYICDCCGQEIERKDEDMGRAHRGACSDALKAFKSHCDEELAKHYEDLKKSQRDFVQRRLGRQTSANGSSL